jgi:hypothetical protein
MEIPPGRSETFRMESVYVTELQQRAKAASRRLAAALHDASAEWKGLTTLDWVARELIMGAAGSLANLLRKKK